MKKKRGIILKKKARKQNKQNYAVIISVMLVFVSFLVAVKLLSNVVTDHFDDEIIVCLDAGHGGSDVGAVAPDGKRYEKDDNLNLTLKVRDELERMGIKTVLTRDEDTTVSLKDRCKIANKKRSDLFVSIHRNSSANGTGFEAWISKTEKENEKSVASDMVKALSKVTGLENRGVKSGYRDRTARNYYVNSNTNMPSILLECSFITSDEDNKVFDEKIDTMANEIAKVIYDAVQN